jgi:hypothetical protein
MTPVLALTPSTVKELAFGRCPLAVNCPASPRVAGMTLAPGVNSIRLRMPRPFSGRRSISPRSTRDPVDAS